MAVAQRHPEPLPRSTVERILAAARSTLLSEGYAGLSTRAVAKAAGVHLSLIHYHFGSKRALVLALFESEDERLRARQAALFHRQVPLAEKWLTACDYLEVDLKSGYVPLLHQLIAGAAGDEDLAAQLRTMLIGWIRLIAGLARDSIGDEVLAEVGLTPESFAALAGSAFLGAEANILLGIDEAVAPNRAALRAVGGWLAVLEARAKPAGRAG